MRIGFVSPYYSPAMIGGIEWYLYNVCRRLARRGHEIHVFCTNKDAAGLTLAREESTDGISIHRSATHLDISYRAKIWPSFASHAIRSGLDVLHVFDYAQFHVLMSLLVKPKLGCPMVSTIYDLQSQIPRSRWKSAPIMVFDGAFARKVLQLIDIILVRTPLHREFLSQRGIEPHIIKVAPPGLEESDFRRCASSEAQEAREKFGLGSDRIVLYVGRIHPIKGVDVIIRATPRILESSSDAKVAIAGRAHARSYQLYLDRLAKELGVEDKVHFLGHVSHSDKDRLISTCELLMLPSSFEGFGQSLAQAMAKRKPVVASRVGGIPWLVQDGVNGTLVEYGDINGLSDAVSHLLQDRNLALSLGRRGRARVTSLAYENLVEDLENIYEEASS